MNTFCALFAMSIFTIQISIAYAGQNQSSNQSKIALARPNIIFINTDDQRFDSIQNMPAVTRLLKNKGLSFSESFASYPLCCPSRATTLTGQYAHNHKVLGIAPPNGGYAALDHNNTLPVWLQNAGYHTAMFGKYLNGYGKGIYGADVKPAGWNEWQAFTRTGYTKFKLSENGNQVEYKHSYATDVLAAKVQSYINQRGQDPSRQPFYIYFAPYAPHYPHVPAKRHKGRLASVNLSEHGAFNEEDITDKPAFIHNLWPKLDATGIANLNLVHRQRLESALAIDEAVDQIVETLNQNNLRDNTIIIFTSDNGYMMGEHRITESKRVLYEESIRVPLIISGPGFRFNGGQVSHELVANIDLVPTILDLAQASAGRVLDGKSLVPLAQFPSTAFRTHLLLHGGTASPKADPNDEIPLEDEIQFVGLRTKDFKYIYHVRSKEEEFYDLRSDSAEMENKIADPSHSNTIQEIKNRLNLLKSCVGVTCW